LSGIVKVEGLFDGDPTDATLTPGFNSIQFAAQNGPDGSQTLFNTQSNLNDVTIGADGKVYTVDAARNVIYGLEQDGTTLDSVTVIEKRPPVLTPPQYAAVIEAGGNPAADYRVEISEQTTKGPNGLPDTPGRVAALAASDASQETDQGEAGGTEGTGNPDQTPPPPRGEDSVVGVNNAAGDAGVPGAVGPIDPTVPGPVDPTSEPVRADNPYAPYFAPFFGNYAPAPNDKPVLPAGEQGSYIVSNVYSFGDRLAEDGGDYGANAVAKAAGVTVPWTTAPYSSLGNFTDGLNWTDYLSQALGVADSDQDTNFAYLNATARALENSLDPLQSTTSLSNFAGQIDRFEQSYGRLSPTDLVTVTFGGNDLTLPSDVTPQEGIDQSVDAIVDGLERLQCLGGEHFLVTNLPDVSLAPIFSDPNFLEALGGDPGFDKLVAEFNVELGEAVKEFSQRTGADVTLLDVNKLFDGIKANPDAYGFINVEEPVLQNTPMPGTTPEYNPAIVGQDPAVQHATLFIDSFFHPTALGHSLIAETAWHAIA
jgi:phospholipase/lecithinase/hemolysin